MKLDAGIEYVMRPASDETLAKIGLSPEKNKVQKALALFEKLNNRTLVLFFEICSKCGACANQCHTYIGTKDPKNIPAGRANLLRKVYRKHFTPSGKLLGRLVGAQELSDEVLEDWYRYFYQCNECRRCAVFCPFGIDTSEMTSLGRQILSELGMVPKYIAEVVANAHKTGNNVGIPEAAMINTCEFLEEDIEEETGVPVKIPLNKDKADVLYVPPSADLFVNADTMIGAAKAFHSAGADWTMSTYASEAANFGLFFEEKNMKELNRRVVDEAKRIGAKTVVFGECGHGWRVAKNFTKILNPDGDFEILNILEYTAKMLKEGKIKVNPEKNPDAITLHDPCNMGRGAGLLEEPREILKAVSTDFREMTPNREQSFCCGGGGGLLADEIMEFRMKAGIPKAESVKKTGAKYVAAPCAICKAQLPLVMKHYGLDVEVGGVMDLVSRAIELEGER